MSTPLGLREISLSEVAELGPPNIRIHTDEEVSAWTQTTSFRDYAIFLRRLNVSVVGHFLPYQSTNPSPAISKMVTLLDTLDHWINEIPPQETPQRFGNLSFRTWGSRLEECSDSLLHDLLPHSPEYASVVPLIKPYFITSFGSFLRMDYGTGHETSFALFLLCLTLVRYFQPEPEEERALVFSVFIRYLRLCWRLQDVYRLEPAGSHGVWGLDDSSFLGYILGSGQLRDQTNIPVNAILNPPLPPTNLYFMSIMRIHEVKSGPFHEHSSQLFSIATSVPNWGKVNTGLFKMYEAEVLGKRVVVQHIPLGGILRWDPPAGVNRSSISRPVMSQSTQAPWISSVAPGSMDQRLGKTESSFSASINPVSGSRRLPETKGSLMGPPSFIPSK